ncbi:hypothetical protein ABU162_20315 [Paenibacillus thiaminolyticus]|uniref:hypothetical protein n=1 Tax=Paenibacillus thiaminolyticus TaxID=49283 RepID=UPI0035A6BE47
MAKPSLITVIIFKFMASWNEYIMTLSFLSTETKRTLTLRLTYLMEVQYFATDWGALFAGLVIMMIPTMVAYALLQRQMTAGISMGGLKGWGGFSPVEDRRVIRAPLNGNESIGNLLGRRVFWVAGGRGDAVIWRAGPSCVADGKTLPLSRAVRADWRTSSAHTYATHLCKSGCSRYNEVENR